MIPLRSWKVGRFQKISGWDFFSFSAYFNKLYFTTSFIFILTFSSHTLISKITWKCQNKDETSREIQLVEIRRKFQKIFSFSNSHPIVTRGSRVFLAPLHHTPPAFLNLHGINYTVIWHNYSELTNLRRMLTFDSPFADEDAVIHQQNSISSFSSPYHDQDRRFRQNSSPQKGIFRNK